ncbi:MAG: TlpA family protein disulfide reductase [Thermoanaerobaculia bacterium]|nr:TlpA family protein disulfide reductase [Thermoanaerobaculia bacterium]
MRVDVYSLVLHVALIGLCVVTVLLAGENRRLKQQLAPPANGPAVGESVEPIRWLPLDGDETTLDFASSGRDSLLFVFTTDCPACRETQSSWRDLHSNLAPAVDVVGISLSGPAETRSYRDDLGLSYRVGVPVEQQALVRALSISGVPVTLRVGPDGRIVGSWSGTLSAVQVSEVAAAGRG